MRGRTRLPVQDDRPLTGLGERYREPAAATFLTLDAHFRAHPVAELFHEIESRPQPAGLARRGGFDLDEGIEDATELLASDPAPAIHDADLDPVAEPADF